MTFKAIHTEFEEKFYDSRYPESLPNTIYSKVNFTDAALSNAHNCFEDSVLNILYQYPLGCRILDYGCGTGDKSLKFASDNWEVVGIDISKKSIELAKNRSVNHSVIYNVMDCERMQFPADSFDVVFDYGTFSSLDMEKAFPEILRVLKPTGSLIAIETLAPRFFNYVV